MKQFACVLVLLLLMLCPALINAELTQSLEGVDSLRVGDVFTMSIDSDTPIAKVGIPDSLTSFAIVGSKAKAKDKRSWELTIVPLSTGALSFPRLQVLKETSDTDPEFTDGFRVHVLSVLAEGDTLLRDIKPLERHPLQLPFGVYLLLLFLAMGLGLYLFLTRIKSKAKVEKHEVNAAPAAVTIPPWQKAISELDELLAKGFLERAAWLQLYFGLSQILRSFLEAEYHFDALEMTVSEIRSAVQHRKTKNGKDILDFLQLCDLVKFAKAEPDNTSTQERIQWLRQYLHGFDESGQVLNHA